ncbi:MAG: hypothetical protein UW12_C0043G0002 [Parcubacteria group bacterium GW2011_GWF1_43_9]|nr:MAG: hypothetical protein UW12_C0043G0002 [Parcubacteria group bacterium GW2011_GWF1_43_9]
MPKLFKTIYVFLFVALVVQPHVVDHVSFVPKAYVESIVTLVIMGLAYSAYYLHRRELAKREHKRRELEAALGLSEQKLIDAFQYIGFINRRLPWGCRSRNSLTHFSTSGLLIAGYRY